MNAAEVREAKNKELTFADAREVHAAPNKARHVCERPRDGERAVSRERPVSSGDVRTKLVDFSRSGV